MLINYENSKKHTGNTLPQNLILISKNKPKEKQNVLFVYLKGLLLINVKTNII